MEFKLIDRMTVGFQPEPPGLAMELFVKGPMSSGLFCHALQKWIVSAARRLKS